MSIRGGFSPRSFAVSEASQLVVHQNDFRADCRYWGDAPTIDLQPVAPIIKPIPSGNQKYPLIITPQRLEPLLGQIEIATQAKISGGELHFRVRVQPLNGMRKVEEKAGEVVRLKFANDLIVGPAELLDGRRDSGRRKLIFDQIEATIAHEKKNDH